LSQGAQLIDAPIWRPPSEADSLIIQAAKGCSYNHCTFCSMYRDITYHPRPLPDVLAEIDAAAAKNPDVQRVFIADADAWGLPTATLLAICERLHLRFPALSRIAAYATPFNLLHKTPDELIEVRDAGLRMAYVGIESGSDKILKRIVKGSAQQMEEGLRRGMAAGLEISATVITGLGGAQYWREHIEETAELINRVPPTYLSTLQMVLNEDSVKSFLDKFGDTYEPQTDRGILQEIKLLVELIDPPRPLIFRTNHASNALALAGTLPQDRSRLLSELDRAISGKRALRPGWMRGL
jgi:coproporphyrinogen III oxidase-like Fe-S oxidoreductase